MGAVGQWAELEKGLPGGWGEARFRLVLEAGEPVATAASILGPLQPLVSEARVVTFRVATDGSGPSPEMARRTLAHLDDNAIHGRLELLGTAPLPVAQPERVVTLAESWDSALQTLPADWSDLVGEVELESSDFLDRAALNMAPLNPRRDSDRTRLAFQFRCARTFGYGASPGMARRCLGRCDGDGFRGRVRILWALSDTRPVQTQGPVWHVAGRTV